MIRIGMVGLGGISAVHLDGYSQVTDKACIVARCDKIPERANGTAQGITINIGSGGGGTQLQAKPYTDYHELVCDPEVDAVDICTPTDVHAEIAIAALEAGKHVLCEKPMAFSVEQCDRVIAAAKASGRILMVAHCIRFWPEYVFLKDLIDNGKYGELKSVSFSRLGGPPLWSSENWLMTPSRSGGSILDLHVHDVDFIAYLFGKPKQISTVGREDERGIGYTSTRYLYENGPLVSAEGGWDFSPKFPFRMTYVAHFAGATLEWAFEKPLMVYPADGEAYQPELLPGNGYQREIAYFLDCIERGVYPTIVTPEDARESVRLVYSEMAALRSGNPITL